MSESEFGGTVALTTDDSLDPSVLRRWLLDHLDGCDRTLAIEKFRGGQSNPTFLLRVRGNPRFVLRKKPAGVLLPSAHAVEREYRVMTALGPTGFPVPRTCLLCEETAVVGTAFFVMEYVQGRSFWDPALPGMTPAERGAIYDELSRVIASLHGIDPASVGLADYGKAGNFFKRQIDRWTRQYRASQTEVMPVFERLIEWFPSFSPPDERPSLVHGDYRLDNLIFHPREPRILAVLDWELSTLGAPLADLACHVMGWRMPHGELGGLAGCDFGALGIPTEPTYVDRYCVHAGREPVEPRLWAYCMAYSLFRIACIRQGILKRALEGNASSAQAIEVGRGARSAAEAAWTIIERQLA